MPASAVKVFSEEGSRHEAVETTIVRRQVCETAEELEEAHADWKMSLFRCCQVSISGLEVEVAVQVDSQLATLQLAKLRQPLPLVSA